MTEINQHDVGTPKDYAHQIILAFKHLEHGVSDFQGHKVMEGSEEEMMYELIEEAINQAIQAEREHIVAIIKTIMCSECYGSGAMSTPSSYDPCRACDGTGAYLDGSFNDIFDDLIQSK